MALEHKVIEIESKLRGRIVEVSIIGRLEKKDYERFVPELEALIDKHKKIRILLKLFDFKGWTAGAVWEDIKFDIKHFTDVERIAIIGDKKWEHGMAIFCKPFTMAKVRYFDLKDIAEAEDWILEDFRIEATVS